ncbi:MAG TPA: anhydro-N-acetylmuramic acid kinase [Gemmataceae bacterium]
MPTHRRLIGLASGSGNQAVDAALVELIGVGLELSPGAVYHLRQPLPPGPNAAPADWGAQARANRLLGEAYAAAAVQLFHRHRLGPGDVQAAGCLGPLRAHEPDARPPATVEAGMPALVAERTGLTTVSDFRERDLAAGGQGMPVTALADYLLYRSRDEDRLLVHLGSVSSLVHIPAGGRLTDVTAFEAGPCNRLLDGLIAYWTEGREPFDPGGRHAVQGRCLEPLLRQWAHHPYLSRRPPKSLARSEFGPDFLAAAGELTRQHQGALQDLLCTATHFAAECVAQACRRWLPVGDRPLRVFLSGGGTRNGLLWSLLQQRLAPLTLESLDALGVPAAGRSAAAAAVLAALALDGVPANSPGLTGAAGARLLGRITPGGTRNWAACLKWMGEHLVEPWLLPAA